MHSFEIGIILFQDEHEGQEIGLWGPDLIMWNIGLIGMPPLEVCFIKVWLRAQKALNQRLCITDLSLII